MDEELQKPAALSVVFFKTLAGNEPVRDWLKALEPKDRLLIGQDLQRVQFRFPIGMPLCRPMGSGLWEVRTDISHGTTARVFFVVHDEKIILLHGFEKRTRTTPPAELELARKRHKEFQSWKPTRT